jgi:hypothetical protein
MRILTIAAAVVAFFATVCSGFGQALAEGAIVHANSAATTTKVGSVLGDALSKAMTGNAHEMKSSSARNTERVSQARSKTVEAGATESSGRFVITYIRGGYKPSAVSPAVAEPASSDKTQTGQAKGSPSPDCGNPAATQSKSVINLSFPK